MKECPIKTLKRWVRMIFPAPVDQRRQQLAAMVADLDEHALLSWREGHHLFFVLILTSALELRRFLAAITAGDAAAAIRHLDRVSLLMIGSGAAMRIAGDVNQDSYLNAVVPSMIKAHPKFSGSDSEDHAALVHVYREIEPVIENLPPEVIPAYRRFVSSVQTAMRAHSSVCAMHRGDDRSSTGSGSGASLTGVEILRRLGLSRLRFLFGRKSGKCPFRNFPRRHENDRILHFPAIFAQFPEYRRGIVVATGIRNAATAPAVLQNLREAEGALHGAMSLEQLLASQKFASWRDALRRMGVNPSEHRPAHEALARRALQGKPLPDINPAVNVGNVLSLRHAAPIGVHPLDAIRTGMDLRLASGDESFTAFGSEKPERPRAGEIVFADGNEILCRCWVWRQSRSSVTSPEARSIVVNIDALPPLTEADIVRISEEASAMILAACGGQTAQYILSASNPAVSFEV